MRPTNLVARVRRPAVITMSIAAVAIGFLPAAQPAPAKLAVQRVVATPKAIASFVPVSLSVPAIGLNAPIQPVLTTAEGAMGAPTDGQHVGWWAGRKPGQGNVLLDGHHDWAGADGSFFFLYKLKPGDTFTVSGADNKSATYRIIWIKDYNRLVDASDLLGNSSGEQIATLITCAGVFDTQAGTHNLRLVARAQLVSV